MGRYSKSNFGQIMGKVGNAIGGKWRGVNYLRSLPTKSKRPRTMQQLAVQARLSLAARVLSPIKDILNIGFADKKQKGMTSYNAGVSAFIATAISGDYPNYLVNYAEMAISRGTLGKLSKTSISFNGNLLVDWVSLTDRRTAFEDDEVVILIFNATTGLYLVNESALRSDQNASIDIVSRNGDVVHAWAFCMKREGNTVSGSQYLGTVTVS